MAEEAQELTVTNAAQPIVVAIEPAYTDEEAQSIDQLPSGTITVEITPAAD